MSIRSLFIALLSPLLLMDVVADDELPAVEAVPDARINQYESDGIVVPPASAEETIVELSTSNAARYLDHGAIAWVRNRGCVSCHTTGTYLFLQPLLAGVSTEAADELLEFAKEELKSMQDLAVEDLKSGTRPAQIIYIAAGLAAADAAQSQPPSEETSAALQLMFDIQQDNGTWGALDCWPPFESSAYQEATMAAMAITAHPDWLTSVQDEELLSRIERLKSYLRGTAAPHEYGRVLKLWASLRWGDVMTVEERETTTQLLLSKQQDDGGWSMRQFAEPEEWGDGSREEKLRSETNFEAPESDGHMTGLALIVLQESGMTADADSVRQGLDWLRTHQRESGRWWTRSLNTDDWHFITYSGTAYPLLALQMSEE
ncbi:MAG: hypothetical protein MK102_19545 [Fuerstiella sp.]|nr:hypothetical protein [Fuerstiella sp.]